MRQVCPLMAFLAVLSFPLTASPQLPKGIVVARPASGAMVETDQGWMIAYGERIPGTDFTFRMIPIPGGTFQMGSPPDERERGKDEGPQILVRVAPMWVGQCEVTMREYDQYKEVYTVFKEIVRDGRGYKDTDRSRVDVVTAPTAVYDTSYQFEFGEEPNHPAASMTRYAAKQYTKWLSILTKQQYRLPTEAEWEYACRAGTPTRFSWGDGDSKADQYASHLGNSKSLNHVGAKQANGFGLYDMHGNAGEWTVNAYTHDGYQWLKDREPIDAVNAVRWPDSFKDGVVRGGSIEFDLHTARSAARIAYDDEQWRINDPGIPQSPWWYAGDPSRTIGFRVFRSATPLKPEVISKFWNHTSADLIREVQHLLEYGRGAVGIVNEEVLEKLRAKTNDASDPRHRK